MRLDANLDLIHDFFTKLIIGHNQFRPNFRIILNVKGFWFGNWPTAVVRSGCQSNWIFILIKMACFIQLTGARMNLKETVARAKWNKKMKKKKKQEKLIDGTNKAISIAFIWIVFLTHSLFGSKYFCIKTSPFSVSPLYYDLDLPKIHNFRFAYQFMIFLCFNDFLQHKH